MSDDEFSFEERNRRLDVDLDCEFGSMKLSDVEDDAYSSLNEHPNQSSHHHHNQQIHIQNLHHNHQQQQQQHTSGSNRSSPYLYTNRRQRSTNNATLTNININRSKNNSSISDEEAISKLKLENYELMFQLEMVSKELAKYKEENALMFEVIKEKEALIANFRQKFEDLFQRVKKEFYKKCQSKRLYYMQPDKRTWLGDNKPL